MAICLSYWSTATGRRSTESARSELQLQNCNYFIFCGSRQARSMTFKTKRAITPEELLELSVTFHIQYL